jgi:hypothetical protein
MQRSLHAGHRFYFASYLQMTIPCRIASLMWNFYKPTSCVSSFSSTGGRKPGRVMKHPGKACGFGPVTPCISMTPITTRVDQKYINSYAGMGEHPVNMLQPRSTTRGLPDPGFPGLHLHDVPKSIRETLLPTSRSMQISGDNAGHCLCLFAKSPPSDVILDKPPWLVLASLASHCAFLSTS